MIKSYENFSSPASVAKAKYKDTLVVITTSANKLGGIDESWDYTWTAQWKMPLQRNQAVESLGVG